MTAPGPMYTFSPICAFSAMLELGSIPGLYSIVGGAKWLAILEKAAEGSSHEMKSLSKPCVSKLWSTNMMPALLF